MYWERDAGTWRPQIYEAIADNEGCCSDIDNLLDRLANRFEYDSNKDNILFWGLK